MNLRTHAWCLVFAITAADCGTSDARAGDRIEHSLSRSTSRFSSPAFTSYVGTAAQESIDIDRSKPWREILHLCPLDGSPVRPLVADVELRHRFDWSKTGRQIAFTGSLKGTGQSLLAVIDVDQGIESMQSVENTDDPDWVCADGSIDWHPRGDHLLVLNAVGNLSKPFGIALNANAKNIDHATTIPPDVGIGDACYTPDGKSIIAVFTSR